MKKLSFLTLIISLIVPLTCQQSVEPGEKGFPTSSEIKNFIWQSAYSSSVKAFMINLIDKKPDWIKKINEIYLKNPDLDLLNKEDAFWKVINKKISIQEIEETTNKINENNIDRIGAGAATALIYEYYKFLQTYKHTKNGHK